MAAEVQIASLLRIAAEDLEGAKLLQKAGNRNSFYLCEQAAEKVIRAVLTSEGQHGGIRHHLDEMVDLIPDINPMKARLRAVEELSAYATTWRYPTPGGRVPRPKGDLASALLTVEAILTEVVERFGVDLSLDTPARNARPFR